MSSNIPPTKKRITTRRTELVVIDTDQTNLEGKHEIPRYIVSKHERIMAELKANQKVMQLFLSKQLR